MAVSLKPPTESIDYLTERQIAVLPAESATSLPPPCPANIATRRIGTNAAVPSDLDGSFADARTTLLTHDLFTIRSSSGDPPPVISAGSPFCRVGNPHGTSTEYTATRPGGGFVYFAGPAGAMTVEQLVIINRPTPLIEMRSWLFALSMVLLLAGVVGLVLRARPKFAAVPQDLRRADDTGGSDTYDPEKASRAAFDVFDTHSRP